MGITEEITAIAEKTKIAAMEMADVNTRQKNEILTRVAALLVEKKDFIQSENSKDLDNGRKRNLSEAMLDRLELSDAVIDSMVKGLQELVVLQDPVGKIEDFVKRPNGLQVGRMRIPLGVIAMIYESRPNVTIDAAALCLKAGNGVILRGGSEAIHSNLALAEILREALIDNGVSGDVVQVIPTTDREAVTVMLGLDDYIDLVIPRGGEGLIRSVVNSSKIPVLKHYKGVCHIYVDKDADPDKAVEIIVNAKTHRVGVCNALEGVLLHKDLAQSVKAEVISKLIEKGVEIKGCKKTCELDSRVTSAVQEDWGTEFLELILCMKVVDDYEQARTYIRKYGSLHTETIITENYSLAQRFIREIDASAVMVNASTRFNDGGQLGLGAEIGISTTKLHAYGPMGLEELTTRKFVVYGEGQIRV